MKTIVDSCVWSLSLRRGDPFRLSQAESQIVARLREAIQIRCAAIVGPIRQEVLSGIRDKAVFAKIEQLLEPFRDEEILTADYVEAARLVDLCRSRGVQCGTIDMLVCTVALRSHFGILTNDNGLLRCIGVLRAEGFAI